MFLLLAERSGAKRSEAERLGAEGALAKTGLIRNKYDLNLVQNHRPREASPHIRNREKNIINAAECCIVTSAKVTLVIHMRMPVFLHFTCFYVLPYYLNGVSDKVNSLLNNSCKRNTHDA